MVKPRDAETVNDQRLFAIWMNHKNVQTLEMKGYDMKKIRILKDLRVLKRNESYKQLFLCHSGSSLIQGTEVEVGDEVECSYDHSVLKALPLLLYPDHYILARDVDSTYWMCSGEEIGQIESSSEKVH